MNYVGHLVGNFDVATLVTAIFFVTFVFWLIVYLRMEDRREGYPLEHDLSGELEAMGPHAMCDPKTFHLARNRTYTVPNDERDTRPVKAAPSRRWAGSPLIPTGDPIIDGVGPAAWTERADIPDPMWDGSPRIIPISSDSTYWLAPNDPDPRGMKVVAADGVVVGEVTDVWIDRPECMIRYYQVGSVLVPFTRGVLDAKKRTVYVSAVDSAHFNAAPKIGGSTITLRQEDRILGYFSGGGLYTKTVW
ncbi:PRC-barrel domain-containing protein [Phaeovibrio sulfidiphilus]|uniref:PRC-barrel domain-containing protein n=1 Tax=Phaeovibrio sulfidiphilus TaxID=1220600 RepID=A0A8J6YKH6_9PROT|nr:photosynthetic reaction center subunit H [Phaeovibrio sulfidiphilus]MBE1236058.1 PRC-barrel domain-containing protein [Phaeovibrio sulfidiphilus]